MTELGGAPESFTAKVSHRIGRAIAVTRAKPALMSAMDVLEYRRRIRDHVYDSPRAADQLARRILRSGDL